MSEEFKPLFDKTDPRDDPRRDPSKPVMPDRSTKVAEKITDDSIRLRNTYPKGSLPLSETCFCDGMKWVSPPMNGKEFGVGHPDFGKYISCSCVAAESEGKKRQWLWDKSGLDASVQQPTFSEFKDDLSTDAKFAKEQVISWVNDEASTWLTLIGDPGLGKTHLSRAAAASLISLNKPVMFATVRTILNNSRTWISTKQNDKWIDYIASIGDIQYLILDDLGQEYATDWSRQVLFDIIDTRYESRRPTLITTNIKVDNWSEYLGNACADRLQDYTLTKQINMRGKSVRQKMYKSG